MTAETVTEVIERLHYRVAELERRSRNRKRTGTISDVDHEKGLYRVKLGDQAKPYVTDWIRPRQLGAGLVKIDVLLSQGEQVDVISESGDMTDAQIDLSSYSDANPRSNTETPLWIGIGSAVFAMSGDQAHLKAGKIILEGNVEVRAGTLKHDDVDVGKTHKHTDVQPGDELTGPPKD